MPPKLMQRALTHAAKRIRKEFKNLDSFTVELKPGGTISGRTASTAKPSQKDAEEAVRTILTFIGEDPTRPGLLDTPKRYVKAMRELTMGSRIKPKQFMTIFEEDEIDEMIVEVDIPFHSLCEHHLLPFSGVAHVGYIPNTEGKWVNEDSLGGTVHPLTGQRFRKRSKIVGLSKLPRLVHMFAARLQVQEKLTKQIADIIVELIDPIGVGVVMRARHMCMECRGVKVPGVKTVTSAMRGAMKAKPEARAEFLGFIRDHSGR